MANTGNKRPPLTAPKRKFASKSGPKKPTGKSARAKSKPARRRGKSGQNRSRNIFARLFWWLFGGIFRIIWWVGLRASLLLFVVIAGATAYDYSLLPPALDLMDDRQKGSVTMLDDLGEVFAWRGDQFGGLVDSQTVAPQLRNAVVATEDKRFYQHFGISPRGILSAMRINLRAGRNPLKGNGGSTITQQVAKRVFYSDTGSIERKIKEVPMSFAMELKYTKDEILTIYMNRAYLGAGSNGFEAASQRYFSKSSKDVTVPEAAMLAGLLKSPSATAPTHNMARAQDRANLIVGLMQDQGYLTAEQADNARTSPAELSATAAAQVGGYFADWIMESGPDFILKKTTEDIIIRTTFDRRIQKAAEDALNFIFETRVDKNSKAQAAIVVLSKDGAVRAMVGGRKSSFAGGFNRATQALRQTGSSFKPFVYATALEQGYRYDSIVEDAPLTINIPGSGPWTPKNYAGKYLGPITLTTALAKSVNTAAVRVSEAVGREKVRALAADFGIRHKLAKGPALALGASESTLLEMSGAYAGILNSGRSAEPYGIDTLTLQGDSAPLISHSATSSRRVINDHAAQQLVYMMNQVVETGSGRRARIKGREIAGKTGTTQGARDAWFIGFTADYVTGVWMGNDDNTKLKGVTGGGLPADIWRETMVRVLEGTPNNPLPMYSPAASPKVDATGQVTARGNRAKNPLRQIGKNVRQNLKQLDKEAQNVLGKVLEGIFGKRKK